MRGSIYFAAHPADLLLYQNPALFHDFYVFKCTTAVLFTSGDRGIVGNYSRLLERGFEEAVLYMNRQPLNSTWDTLDVQFNGKLVLLHSPRELPHVQAIYLRLPNATPDGQSYPANDGGSLKKLFNNEINTLAATDGSAIYTLESLKDLIVTILKKREASDIHVLDYKTPIPEDYETHCDHADHSVSARLVAEVIENENITTHLRGYRALISNAQSRAYSRQLCGQLRSKSRSDPREVEPRARSQKPGIFSVCEI